MNGVPCAIEIACAVARGKSATYHAGSLWGGVLEDGDDGDGRFVVGHGGEAGVEIGDRIDDRSRNEIERRASPLRRLENAEDFGIGRRRRRGLFFGALLRRAGDCVI